jgi:Subtilisin inhibitor-like
VRLFVAIVVLVIAGVATAVGGTAPGVARSVSLTITYWDDEQSSAAPQRWTLECNPLGGTLPNRKRACAKLSSLPRGAFARVPEDAICTQIYGGPQKAVVKGTIGSQRIWSSFRRRNGCEISRWQRFSPWLLPHGGVNLISVP